MHENLWVNFDPHISVFSLSSQESKWRFSKFIFLKQNGWGVGILPGLTGAQSLQACAALIAVQSYVYSSLSVKGLPKFSSIILPI